MKDAETLKKKMLQLEKEKEELTMKNTNLEVSRSNGGIEVSLGRATIDAVPYERP